MKLNYLSPMKRCSGILRYALVISFVFSCMIFQTQAQLSGTYTIDPAKAASATNYKNFRSLETDIDSGKRYDGGTPHGMGVTGNVDVKIADGTYNEDIQTGILTTNDTVTFESASGDSSKVIITGTLTINWMNTRWSKLGFYFAAPPIYGIYAKNSNFILQHCDLKSRYNVMLLEVTSDNAQIINNRFGHCSQGIFFYGSNSSSKTSHIENNIFDSLKDNIRILGYRVPLIVSGNTITNINGADYGIDCEMAGVTISKNRIYLPKSGTAIQLTAYETAPINIVNNILISRDNAIAAVVFGQLNIYYNTIKAFSSNYNATPALHIRADKGQLNFMNNIVSVKNLQEIFQAEYLYVAGLDSDVAFNTCDYNVYDMNGTKFSYKSFSLCDWQKRRGLDSHSFTGDPEFTENLTPSAAFVAEVATPASNYKTDINGNTRDSAIGLTPGAIETKRRDLSAAFSYCMDTSGNASFRDTSISHCGLITSYFWDFGDGSTSSSKNISHKFKPGVYRVKLAVKSNGGCADTVSEVFRIEGQMHPDFTVHYHCGYTPVFTDSSFIDSSWIVDWHWDFGDGSHWQGPQLYYSYAGSQKTRSVTLTVTSYYGKKSSVTKKINEPVITLGAAFYFLNHSDTIQLVDTTHNYANLNIKKKIWYKGDYWFHTDSFYDASPQILMNHTGVQYFSLFYTLPYCGDSLRYTVRVNPAIRADFSYTTGSGTFYFTNTSDTGVVRLWDFGDGTTSTLNNPSHIFLTKGPHNIRLFIFDKTTQTYSGIQKIIAGPKSKAEFTADVACRGSVTTFTDKSIDTAGGTLSYYWNFGDGTTSTSQNPTHKFANTETVWLKVSSTSGFIDSISHLVTIDTTCVWPGDANSDKKANIKDVLNIGLAYGDSGAVRSGASISWTAQPCQDWTKSFASGVNHKHADCNGDGKVNVSDLGAIVANYGSTHPKTGNIGKGGPGDPVLYLSTTKDSVNVSDTLHVLVNLGTLTTPVRKVYGIAFSIWYDNTAVDTTKALITDFSKCWLGTTGKNLISLVHNNAKAGVVDIAISRTDHLDVAGYGQIGNVGIIIPDNVAGKDYIHKKLRFGIIDVKGITAEEADVSLNTQDDSVLIYQEKTLLNNKQDKDAQLLVYPNPTNGQLFITSTQNLISQVQVMDITGRIILAEKTANQPQYILNTQALSSGIYYLDVLTNVGPVRTRFVKQ